MTISPDSRPAARSAGVAHDRLARVHDSSAPESRSLPPAVVVGLCVHGLATTRALAEAGVRVIALEADHSLPGMKTSRASVQVRGPMSGSGLSKTLVELAVDSRWALRPVLFLMNDNMVRDVAEHWAALAPYYQLSWSDSTATVLRVMKKDNLQAICAHAGVRFPPTARYTGQGDEGTSLERISFPAIVKPCWPLGSFKAIIVNSRAELEALAKNYEQSLPFVVQQWIPGGPTALLFAAMYLHRGRVLARFEGRKVFAGSDGLGQGTAMAPAPDDAVHETALKFLAGLDLCGPVAIEFKRGPDGALWLIEPNVGRTEYCVDLCTVNGVNLPLIEYRDALGLEPMTFSQRDEHIWFDTDRDRVSWLRYLRQHVFDKRAWRPAFPYLQWGDMGPFFHAVRLALRRVLTSWRKRKEVSQRPMALHRQENG